MSQGNRALYVAGLALVLAIYAAARGRHGEPTGAEACVDPQARAQLGELRRELAERDAMIGRLARAAAAPAPIASAGSTGSADGAGRAAGEPGAPTAPAPAPDPGRRRYARFETSNPAVSVTQTADGGYEIHNSDPSLAGTVMQVTAVAPSGEQTQVLIRIPQ